MDTAAVPSYKGYHYPAEVIAHGVWLYHHFPLSFREMEELLLLQRGITVSYETIRQWCATFGPLYAAGLRRRQPRPGDKWAPGRGLHQDQQCAAVPLTGR